MVNNFEVTKMKDEMESRKIPTQDGEAARKSLIARIKLGEEEQVNLKIKIATFVVYELSKPTRFWFKDYFLSDNFQKADQINKQDKEILKAESEFSKVIASYLITMESEVEYVKKILAPLTDKQKQDFWKPIVSDSFHLAEIYLAPVLEFSKNNANRISGEQMEKKATLNMSSLSPEIQ
jgi:hypothetical protein